jgi:translation elongation factor aEF-1 beta
MPDNVLVVLRVLPESPEVIEKVEEKLRALQGFNVKDIKKEPLAFGMHLLRVAIVLEQSKPEKLSELEKIVSAIEGVSSVEVEATTLI